MSHGRVRGGAGSRTWGALVLALLGLALSGRARAAGNLLPGVVVSDLSAETAQREHAVVVGLLSRSMLGAAERMPVARKDLRAAIEALSGRTPEGLTIAATLARPLLERLGADRIFLGQFRAEQTHWEVRGQILGPDGNRLFAVRAQAPTGEVDLLARRLAARLARRLGLGRLEIPALPLEDVRPYARAEIALYADDPRKAAFELELGGRKVREGASAAAELAALVSADPRLSPEARLPLLPLGPDPGAAGELAEAILKDKPTSVPARAARARALAVKGALAPAASELEKLAAFDKDPAVMIANAALLQQHARGAGAQLGAADAGKSRAEALEEERRDRRQTALYLAIKDPDSDAKPVLAFMSGSDAGSFPPEIEGAAVEAAGRLQTRNPGLASRVGTRAVMGGVKPQQALGLIKVESASSAELAQLKGKLELLGPDVRPGAEALGREIAARAARAEEVRLAGASRAALVSEGALAGVLRTLLARFESLEDQAASRILIVPQPGEAAWYLPLFVRHLRLHNGLTAALWNAPYEMWLAPPPSGGEPAGSDEALARLGDEQGADLVLAHAAAPSGLAVAVELVLVDVATRERQRVEGSVPGWAHALLRLNPLPVAILALLFALPLIVLILRRRASGLRVRILFEDTEDRMLTLVVSQSGAAPRVDEIETLAPSAKVRVARNIEGTTTFPRLLRGKWFVHLVGSYRTGKVVHTISGGPFSQSLEIDGKKEALVVFSLAGDGAEFHVTVHDQKQPIGGVPVWIDDQRERAIVTDPSGLAILKVPLGKRVIHVAAGGMDIAKTFEVVKRKAHELPINLAWERRVDSVSRVLDSEQA